MRKTKELRFAGVEPSGVQPMRLVGDPVVFEQPTEIKTGDGRTYVEVIHRHALDDCDLSDSTLIFNHDESRVPLARSGRTMALTVTDAGLHMVADLDELNPQAQEVYSAVRRGDLSGMSFAFVVPDGGSRYDAATNTRHIDKIQRIYECSICPHPAYPTASVEARSEIAAAHDAERAKAAARAARVVALLRADRIINHK